MVEGRLVEVKIVLPGDQAILDYFWPALYRNIEQHENNIKSFEEAISNEHSQIATLKAIMARKKELEDDNS